MSVRLHRLRLPVHALTAVLLSASLAACGSAAEDKTADAKPSTTAGSTSEGASSGTATPSATPPPAAPGGNAAGGGMPLAEAIGKLPAAAEVRDGYKRTSFKHWIDEDDDSCDTREEVLLAEALEPPQQGAGCKITGGSWISFYDEVAVTEAGKLDIDHMVPLAEAWDSGAAAWTAERRQRYANDLGFDRALVAVTAKTNRSKGDKNPAQWMPPAASAKCAYIADWVAVKLRWGLAADTEETAALTRYATDCTTTISYEPAP
ncbi:HNH endonuclease family protein [Streptomyces sp. t39]|uniref:HNH endonuclease family protein n=1 Tax=Streptomyces sp. t39 TaxID=1828156 RepID=UPI0021C95983|nr:HNH endonuclease family protein [Streptomyces sp. t39]